MTIALTGTTGALGSLVLSHLHDQEPILVVRDASRAPAGGGEVRVASYAEPGDSLRGVDVLFMVSGSEAVDRREQHRTFVTAAKRAGVGHIVYTSFSGASPDATFTLGRDHADTEQAIRDSGMSWTFLRDNFYADLLPLFADETGAIRGPAGEGRVAAVGRVDIAEVADLVLRDPALHVGEAYHLTGPEALTLAEVAERAGRVLGRDLRFVDETAEEAYDWRRREYGAEQWQLDAWVSTYTAIRDGSVAEVSDDVRRVTGHAPRSLEEVLAPRA